MRYLQPMFCSVALFTVFYNISMFPSCVAFFCFIYASHIQWLYFIYPITFRIINRYFTSVWYNFNTGLFLRKSNSKTSVGRSFFYKKYVTFFLNFCRCVPNSFGMHNVEITQARITVLRYFVVNGLFWNGITA